MTALVFPLPSASLSAAQQQQAMQQRAASISRLCGAVVHSFVPTAGLVVTEVEHITIGALHHG